MNGPSARDLDSLQDWEWEPTQESKRQVRRLLMEWDPLGVSGYPEADDEYDCMISPLMDRLAAGADTRSLAKWISSRRFWHFGDAADEARDTQLAEAPAMMFSRRYFERHTSGCWSHARAAQRGPGGRRGRGWRDDRERYLLEFAWGDVQPPGGSGHHPRPAGLAVHR